MVEIISIEESRSKDDPDELSDPLIINGEEVPQHKVRRFRRRRARGEVSTAISRTQLRHSPENNNIETYLFQARSYFRWCCLPGNEHHFQHSTSLVFYGSIDDARTALSQDQSSAFANLNRACSLASTEFKKPCLGLLVNLVEVLGLQGTWPNEQEIHVKVRQYLLQYLKAMSKAFHGPTHPLTRILDLLRKEFDGGLAMKRVATMLLEQAAVTRFESEETSIEFQINICINHTDAGEYEIAARELQRVLQQAESRLPAHHWLTHRAKRRLANVHRLQGDIDTAENLLVEVFEDIAYLTGEGSGSEEGIWTCRLLARLYENAGRNVEAERHWKLVLDRVLSLKGPDDAETQGSWSDLERVVRTRGNAEDLEQLHRDYEAVFSRMQQWYLAGNTLDNVDVAEVSDGTKCVDTSNHSSSTSSAKRTPSTSSKDSS
jgi:tetratricopeptide (TPR) repeat protein